MQIGHKEDTNSDGEEYGNMWKRKNHSIKLQRKILITNMFLFVIPCLLLSVSIVSFINTEGNRRLNQSKMVVLNQINSNLENYLYNGIAYSESFYSDFEMNRLISTISFGNEYEKIQTKQKVRDYLRENRRLYANGRYNLEIIGENDCNYSTEEDGGQVTVEFPNLEKLKKEAWYGVLKEKNSVCYIPTYESKEFTKFDDSSAFRIARLMRNFNSGRIIGMMDVSVPYETLEELLGEGLENDKQDVFIMNTDGRIIGSTNRELVGKKIINESYLSKLKGYDHGYFQSTSNSLPSQVYYVTNPSTGWRVVMYEERQNLVWSQNKGYVCIIAATVIETLLAIFMSVYNSRYISRPVKKLKQDMRMVYKGDLSVRTELSDIDEFKELSFQFNEMIDKIEELIAQLKAKDEEKRVLELQALQAQINPHFLYNTLASIRFLLEMGMEEKAGESLLALGKLLRKTFSDYRELITVREEMQNLENYLILMSNRYQDTFEWEIQVSDDARECRIPRISVQPLVENSISHGFSGKEDMGHITVNAYAENGELFITVTDDGVGGNAEEIRKLLMDSLEITRKDQVSGIGVKNVQERLQLIFGKEYGMAVENVQDGGICVTMRIPVLDKGEAGEEIVAGERYGKDINY